MRSTTLQTTPSPLRMPLAALLTACFVSAAFASDEPPTPEPPPLTESVNVRLVMLPTTVVDRRGRPVIGLSREDFELSEQGKPVCINIHLAKSDFREGSLSM